MNVKLLLREICQFLEPGTLDCFLIEEVNKEQKKSFSPQMFKWFYSLSERKYDFFCKKLEKLVRWMLISNISIFSLGNRKSNANICLGREVSTNSYSDTGRDQLKSIASKVSISYSIKYVYTCWSVWLPGYGISGKGHGWSK